MQRELAQFCMAETHPIFGKANDSESREQRQKPRLSREPCQAVPLLEHGRGVGASATAKLALTMPRPSQSPG